MSPATVGEERKEMKYRKMALIVAVLMTAGVAAGVPMKEKK